LAWSLLHLVETAPADVIEKEPAPESNEWIIMMWARQKEFEAMRSRAAEADG
jgi:hypothetical protein